MPEYEGVLIAGVQRAVAGLRVGIETLLSIRTYRIRTGAGESTELSRVVHDRAARLVYYLRPNKAVPLWSDMIGQDR